MANRNQSAQDGLPMIPYHHRHFQRAEAVCGRQGKRDKDAARPTSRIVTPETREALWKLAGEDAAVFARFCHEADVWALDDLPGWRQFLDDYPWEASLVKIEARALGIRC